MLAAAYGVYAVAQAALAVWAYSLWRRHPTPGALTLLLPIAAVVYDNAIVATGGLIGAGSLLQALSFPRFLGHALLTPLWTVTAVILAQRADALGKRAPAIVRASWWAYGFLVALGVLNSVVLLRYELVDLPGLVSYTNAGGLPGPPIPSILMVLTVIVCGALVTRATRWPWMLGGALFMLAAAAVPTELVGFLVSNSGEVVLAAALVATEAFLQRRGA